MLPSLPAAAMFSTPLAARLSKAVRSVVLAPPPEVLPTVRGGRPSSTSTTSPAAVTATITDADTGYHLVILEVQELAALAQQQSERLLGRALQQLDQTLASFLQASGDSVDRVTDSAEFIAVLRGNDAERKLQGLREIAEQQHAHGLTVLVGEAYAARADEPIGQVFLRAEVALSAEKDRYRQGLAQ